MALHRQVEYLDFFDLDRNAIAPSPTSNACCDRRSSAVWHRLRESRGLALCFETVLYLLDLLSTTTLPLLLLLQAICKGGWLSLQQSPTARTKSIYPKAVGNPNL